MKCCVSTEFGTWTNWLTLERDPEYSPDAGTGLLTPISHKRWYAEFYVGKIPRIRIGAVNIVPTHRKKVVLYNLRQGSIDTLRFWCLGKCDREPITCDSVLQCTSFFTTCLYTCWSYFYSYPTRTVRLAQWDADFAKCSPMENCKVYVYIHYIHTTQ